MIRSGVFSVAVDVSIRACHVELPLDAVVAREFGSEITEATLFNTVLGLFIGTVSRDCPPSIGEVGFQERCESNTKNMAARCQAD